MLHAFMHFCNVTSLFAKSYGYTSMPTPCQYILFLYVSVRIQYVHTTDLLVWLFVVLVACLFPSRFAVGSAVVVPTFVYSFGWLLIAVLFVLLLT